MYYVLQMDMGRTAKFIYFRKPPTGYDDALLRAGESVKVGPSNLVLTAEDEKPTALSDLLLAPSDMLVMSPKLISCLSDLGVGNLQYFPIRLVDKKRGKTTDDYRLANVVGSIPCLDVDHSVVKRFPTSDRYRVVEQFSLLEDRITPLPGTKAKPLIFRLDEFKYHVLAHEAVKAACENAKITGIEFVPTSEYA